MLLAPTLSFQFHSRHPSFATGTSLFFFEFIDLQNGSMRGVTLVSSYFSVARSWAGQCPCQSRVTYAREVSQGIQLLNVVGPRLLFDAVHLAHLQLKVRLDNLGKELVALETNVSVIDTVHCRGTSRVARGKVLGEQGWPVEDIEHERVVQAEAWDVVELGNTGLLEVATGDKLREREGDTPVWSAGVKLFHSLQVDDGRLRFEVKEATQHELERPLDEQFADG